MIEFKDNVTLTTRLEIVASRIRLVEREIRRLLGRRAEIDRDLVQFEADLLDLKAQYERLVIESGQTHSEKEEGECEKK